MNQRHDERTSFEKLEVYQLAERLSDAIWEAVKDWHYHARDTVGRQMVRSADSIGANLAEGSGRQSPKDVALFTRYSCGSLYETKHWLRRARRRGLLSETEADSIEPMVDELLPRLNAYLASTRRKALPRP